MNNSKTLANKKEKLGTVLDAELVKMLKETALREGRTISDVLADAIVYYNSKHLSNKSSRLKALEEFCSTPFDINAKELQELIDVDFYEV